MTTDTAPAVWFPAIRAGTGADVFTENLIVGLRAEGLRAETTWLPLRAEYAPWSVAAPKPPAWANLVHVNTWLAARFIPHGLPVVATIHHCVQNADLTPYKSFAQRLYHAAWITPLERRTMTTANRIVAVSEYTAGQARRIFGRRDIAVIPNGIDTDIFTPDPNPSNAHEPFRLLFVGTLSQRKGADLLAPIMETLGSAFELWIVGNHKTKAVPLPANAKPVPRPSSASGLAAVYGQCDALLSPTRLEGFGLVAVEAQACGLPIIATRCSSLPEVVDDGATGILCPRDDVAAFAAAARTLAGDAKLRETLRANARHSVERRFSLASMTGRYIDIYRACLA